MRQINQFPTLFNVNNIIVQQGTVTLATSFDEDTTPNLVALGNDAGNVGTPYVVRYETPGATGRYNLIRRIKQSDPCWVPVHTGKWVLLAWGDTMSDIDDIARIIRPVY